VIKPGPPNPEASDIAEELNVLVKEIAAHNRVVSRFMGSYALLSLMNERRDHYGMVLAIDTSRQTLEHHASRPKGIELVKDAGGAVGGISIGPHFASEWELLELARAMAELDDEPKREAALKTVVRQTLIKGETRCWELRPMIDRGDVATSPTENPGTILKWAEVIDQIVRLARSESYVGVERCMQAFMSVLESGTQNGGRVELGSLGSFGVEVRPDGHLILTFQDAWG
jgi:hypothetical protein